MINYGRSIWSRGILAPRRVTGYLNLFPLCIASGGNGTDLLAQARTEPLTKHQRWRLRQFVNEFSGGYWYTVGAYLVNSEQPMRITHTGRTDLTYLLDQPAGEAVFNLGPSECI